MADKLVSQPDGHPARKVKIEVPEAYKQLHEGVWEELEKYLFTGFLVNPASVSDHSFVFKSLNHYEVKNIEFMKPAKSAPADAKSHFRNCFIAYSVFMVDGVNVLFERQRNINRLIKIISKIPPPVQEKIVAHLASLNARAHRLYPLTEVYVHENRSRYRWMQVQNIPVHAALATGIAGTDELGMNYSQQTWIALNRVLDRRDEMERDWSNAKFIGSCFAGKGVRAVDDRDRARLERERVEQEDKKMRVLHAYLNRLPTGEDPPQVTQLPDGRTATVVKKFAADSVEELADQLSAALSGEKDHHDVVVERRIKQLRDRARAIETTRNRIYSMPVAPGAAMAAQGALGGSRVLGGKKEADAYIARIEAMRAEQIEAGKRAASAALAQSSDKGPEEDAKLR